MHRALITLFFFLKVIGIEKKTARGKVTKLKEKLKEARAEVQQKCRGKGKGKGKGKALTSEKVVALEAQIAEEEGNCIRGTMNDKTVDLLQEQFLLCILRYYIHAGLLWECHPGPHQ